MLHNLNISDFAIGSGLAQSVCCHFIINIGDLRRRYILILHCLYLLPRQSIYVTTDQTSIDQVYCALVCAHVKLERTTSLVESTHTKRVFVNSSYQPSIGPFESSYRRKCFSIFLYVTMKRAKKTQTIKQINKS